MLRSSCRPLPVQVSYLLQSWALAKGFGGDSLRGFLTWLLDCKLSDNEHERYRIGKNDTNDCPEFFDSFAYGRLYLRLAPGQDDVACL